MEDPAVRKNTDGFQTLRLYWAGKGKLSVAYWGFGVVGSLLLSIFCAFGVLFVVPFASKDGSDILESTAFQLYVVVILVILLAYQVVASIVIWRNSNNTTKPIWSQLAKASVALSAVLFLYEILNQI
jgi:uncharacterized membrane protein